jgi:hypothetical protein
MESNNNFRDYHQMPVYKIAYDIVKSTKAIVELIDDKQDEWNLRCLMINNAISIPAKIAGAEAVDLFSIKMENAILIKIAAKELQSQVALCKQLNNKIIPYLNILDEEITEFRGLYNGWVSSFDPTIDIDDGWRTFKRN